jgi:hypothetical protein
MENHMPSKCILKVSISKLIPGKTNFNSNLVRRDKEGYDILIKRPIHEEYM